MSRIYSVLRQPTQAQTYAALCLQASRFPDVEPFYLGFAYEALARAASLSQDWSGASRAVGEARALAEQVVDLENKKLLLDDLASIPLNQ